MKKYFYFFALSFVISFVCLNKGNAFVIISMIFATIIIAFYFIWNGRFPPWVQDSLYFLGSAGLLIELGWSGWKKTQTGTWFTGHSVMNRQLEKLGLEAWVDDLIRDNVYIFTNADFSTKWMYEAFYKDIKKVLKKTDLVQQWGNYAIYAVEAMN